MYKEYTCNYIYNSGEVYRCDCQHFEKCHKHWRIKKHILYIICNKPITSVLKTYKKYTIEDGLSSNDFGNGAVCNNNNNFYFGTSNGIVSFNPLNIASNSYVPPVVITDIKILDESYASISDTSLINTYRREKKLLLKCRIILILTFPPAA